MYLGLPAARTLNEVRATFAHDLSLIHEHPEERGLIHQAMHRWYSIFQQATGVDAFDYNGSPSVMLSAGEALGTSGAAFCLLEAQRTAVFLRGIESAIRDLQQRFPGERIRILYAGCGPFATLLTPLIARFTAEEVGWHLLDANPTSLASVQHLYKTLDLESWLLGTELADATQFVVPTHKPFHLVLSETMQRALQNETQLPIMLNLIPQLQPGALFLPHRITIRAELLRWSHLTNEIPVPIFQLLDTIYEVGHHSAAPPTKYSLTIPPLHSPADLYLTTEVEVYKQEILSGNDASITLPKNLHQHVHGGEHFIFHYTWRPPGFRYKRVNAPSK